ncbi:hypothetical protein ACS0PU_006128 [Formica fusca]
MGRGWPGTTAGANEQPQNKAIYTGVLDKLIVMLR